MLKDPTKVISEQLVDDALSDPVDARKYRAGLIQIEAELVDVNANGTSPTLDITVETSIDGENWFGLNTATTFTQFTDTGVKAKRIPVDELGMFVRLNYNLGGSGYASGSVDPDDDVYWNVTATVQLSD